MSVHSTATLNEALRQSRLLEPSQLEELSRSLQTRFPDSHSLARELLKRDWLTPYQINQLLQGGGKDLLVGQYVILERVNESFLGRVFKARHQHMKRIASLTVVRESLLKQPEAVERFYQELQSASQLMHPHLVCAFDAGPLGRTHFIAMEYVEGIDLEQLVKQSGALPPAAAATFVRQAAVGLQYAFQRGLLHHDLRPSNLVLTRFTNRNEPQPAANETPRPGPEMFNESVVKVCNLGLTLLQPRDRGTFGGNASLESSSYQLRGTVDYFAPEQMQGTALTDVRSNLYSLGCIYYYLLAGRAPFPGGTSATKLLQHQREEPTPLLSLCPHLPAAAVAIVHKLMAKRPEDRYQAPVEVAAALAALPGTGPALADCLANAGRVQDHTPPPFLAGKNLVVAARVPERTAPGPKVSSRRQPFAGPSGKKLFYGIAACCFFILAAALASFLLGRAPLDRPPTAKEAATAPEFVRRYRKMPTREETILAVMRDNGFPTLEGKWYYIGPFDNSDKKGFDTSYPPETGIDLSKSYPGKGGEMIAWKEFPQFKPGKVVDLRLFKHNDWAVAYLYHEMESVEAAPLTVAFGSDDTLTVWLNGDKLVSQNVYRGIATDHARPTLNLRPGKNQLLIKVCQGNGGWDVYVGYPPWPPTLEAAFGASLQRDFPSR